jgi:hypothetical protein
MHNRMRLKSRPTSRIASVSIIAQELNSESLHDRGIPSYEWKSASKTGCFHERPASSPAEPDIFYERQALPKTRAKFCADAKSRLCYPMKNSDYCGEQSTQQNSPLVSFRVMRLTTTRRPGKL